MLFEKPLCVLINFLYVERDLIALMAWLEAIKTHLIVMIVGCTLAIQTQGAEKRVFSIGVEDYEHFMPYSQFKNNRYEGLGKAILERFAAEKGYRFDYQVYPLKRRDRMFVEGQLDFIFPDHPYWVMDLKQGLDIQYAPMLEFTDGVVVLPENKGKGLEALKRMGLPLGFTAYQYLDAIKAGKIEVKEIGYDGLYRQVINRRVDGAYVNIKIARYYWQRQGGTNKQSPIVFDPDLPHATGFWSLSSQKYPTVIKEFRAFMRDNPQLIETLKQEYGFYIQ